MALNGSGTFNLAAGNPVVSGATISSTVHNNTMNEIATALSTAIFKDGQQTITANIPFNSNKITGLGAGSNAGDAVRLDQVNIVDPPDATDAGTDAYQANFAHDLATGDTVVADFGSANTTATPTLENTGGAPSGAQSIVTTEGAAFVGMLEARPHRFQWDGTNYVVLDPAGGVVERGNNSNGVYVRFADGMQVAWSEGVTLSGSIGSATTAGIGIATAGQRPTWTFPATFDTAPTVSVDVTGGTTTSAFRMAGANGSPSTSAVDINLFDMDGNNGSTVSVGCIAVGEWK